MNGVITSAGTLAFTRMPYDSNSAAQSRVKDRIAPLAEVYPDVPPCPVTATFDAMFNMQPCDFLSAGKAKCAML